MYEEKKIIFETTDVEPEGQGNTASDNEKGASNSKFRPVPIAYGRAYFAGSNFGSACDHSCMVFIEEWPTDKRGNPIKEAKVSLLAPSPDGGSIKIRLGNLAS